jgi:hypothetical protein
MDRRALFFLGAAVVSFGIAPIGLDEYRHVAVIVGCVYVVYAVLSFLDARSRAATRRRRS